MEEQIVTSWYDRRLKVSGWSWLFFSTAHGWFLLEFFVETRAALWQAWVRPFSWSFGFRRYDSVEYKPIARIGIGPISLARYSHFRRKDKPFRCMGCGCGRTIHAVHGGRDV